MQGPEAVNISSYGISFEGLLWKKRYVRYCIDFKDSKGENFTVFRRYNDFVHLNNVLTKTIASHLLPQLPKKVTTHKQTSEFIETRKYGLLLYLRKLLLNADHRKHPALRWFLTSGDEQFKWVQNSSKENSQDKLSLFKSLFVAINGATGSKQERQSEVDVLQLRIELKNSQESFKSQLSQCRKTITDLEDDHLCVICMVNPRDILYLPCRHFILCGSCYANVQDCMPNNNICQKCLKSVTASHQVVY